MSKAQNAMAKLAAAQQASREEQRRRWGLLLMPLCSAPWYYRRSAVHHSHGGATACERCRDAPIAVHIANHCRLETGLDAGRK